MPGYQWRFPPLFGQAGGAASENRRDGKYSFQCKPRADECDSRFPDISAVGKAIYRRQDWRYSLPDLSRILLSGQSGADEAPV